MTILIIHYHLRAGGVTRVIESQAKVLQKAGHSVVIASSGPTNDWGCSSLLVPELDYRAEGSIPLERLLSVSADLWIIHNPTLGLNVAYPEMIETAAAQGVKMLMQIHDFVEDGRPANYQLLSGRSQIYPDAPHIHYATINRRDLTILKTAGVPGSRCHHLPNAVNPPQIAQKEPRNRLVFYPVRGIRRKNLGEICLLASHAPPDTRFAVALGAGSDEPEFLHQDWIDFAAGNDLPITFNAVGSEPSSFVEWLEQSTHLVTTSIHEGFGLTFLDPAFLGKPLIGRDLPEITCDFATYGTLYQSIPVPLSNLPGLAQVYREELHATMAAYGRAISSQEIEEAWEDFVAEGSVDFGNLPESFQRYIITNVRLPDLTTWLADALEITPGEIDTSPWSLETYSRSLLTILESIDEAGPVEWISPQLVLDQFLHPEKFHFLRSRITLPDTPSTTR